MQRKIVWILVSCLMVIGLALSSCGTKTETPAGGTTVAGEATTPATATTAPTTQTTTTTTPTPSALVPKYGGTLTVVLTADPPSFDPIDGTSGAEVCPFSYTYERLGYLDWTKSAEGTNEYGFMDHSQTPPEFVTGCLAESWEMPDPLTVVYHIRKGVHWQDKPPVNGREFTASDVVYCFYRHKGSPKNSVTFIQFMDSAEATDKYTVVCKLGKPRAGIADGVATITGCFWMIPREMVETYKDLRDWRKSCGTGPFMLTDYASGSSETYKKNPNYWGYDELHPQNKIPYVDTVKALIIPDASTRISALRTGKIDKLVGLSWEDAQSINKSNPELKKAEGLSASPSMIITYRMDVAPYSDLRVRQALQMAIDRQSIIKNRYHGRAVILDWPFKCIYPETLFTPVDKLPPEAKQLFDYSPEKARKLLAEAGFPAGFKADIVTSSTYVDYLSMIVAWWKDIGVEASIRTVDSAILTVQQFGHTFPQMLATSTGCSSPYTDLETYYEVGAIYNYGKINDPVLTELLNKAYRETFIVAEQYKLMKEMNIGGIQGAYYLTLPTAYLTNYWQPWLPGCHGEYYLGRLQGGAISARTWIDQALKEKMAGRR